MSGTSGAPTTLREFVMRLGFTIDEASQRKWTDGIANMTKVAAALGAAVATAAAGVVAGVDKIASSMSGLSFLSERTKSGVGAIEAYLYAIRKLGGDAGIARSSLDKLAQSIKEQPAIGTAIANFTKKPFTGDVLQAQKDIEDRLREMKAEGVPEAILQQRRAYFDLEQDTYNAAMHPEFPSAIAEGAAKQTGDKDQAAKDARSFENIIGGLRESANQAAEQLGAALFKSMGGDLEKLQTLIDTHKKEINDAITAIAKGITHAGELIVKFGLDCVKTFGELKGWYDQLTPANKGLVDGIALLATGIAAFKTSPLGALLVALGAIVELYKDYEKYKAGDKDTMVDWKNYQGIIDGLTNVGKVMDENVGKIGGWKDVFIGLATFVGTIWTANMIKAVGGAVVGMVGALGPFSLALGALGLGVYSVNKYLNMTPQEQAAMDRAHLPVGYDPVAESKKGGWFKQLWDMFRGVGKGGMDSAAQAKSAREAYDFYVGKGMTPAGAAGMVAQEKAESGFDPGAVGDNGSAMGLYQWHQDRRDKILADYGIDISKADANTQREAAWLELHNSERNALDEINKAGNDPAKAGFAGSAYFERPADMMGQGALRGQLATDYLKAFNVPPAVDVGALLATAPPMSPYVGTAPLRPFETGDTHNNHHYSLSITGVTDPRVAADRIIDELRRDSADLARNNTSPVH